MARGGCRNCGSRTTNNRLCSDCQQLERLDFFNTASEQRDRDRDEKEFECTSCGEEYRTDGSDACPNCGARRRRYTGPLPGETA